MRAICFGLVLGLAGCEAGHLGNPVMWPGMAIGAGIENTNYDVRRKKVETYVTAHQVDILDDIRVGRGPALTTVMNLARIPDSGRPELLQILINDIAKFTPKTPQAREQLVVWLMVHGH